MNYKCSYAIFLKIFILILFFNLEFQVANSINPVVKTGIDVLQFSDFKEIAGKKIILFTNSSARNQNGELSAEILIKSPNIQIVSIITPEHGFYASASAGEKVANEHLFGIPVYSLYSEIRKPNSKIISEGDIILVDIQDIGVRSYTYISTLFKIMQAAAENNKAIYILDRPNPLGGENIDGAVLEKGMESFVGIVPIPYIHSLTIGELAYMINEESWLNEGINRNFKCELNIIKMQGYERKMIWEDTGLMWFPTSPNVPNINSVRGLAMIGIFGELGIISIGIGTTTPFQLIGSPNFDWEKVNKFYNNSSCISISKTRYTPQFAMYSQKQINGIFLNFNNCYEFKPFSEGIKLFLAIRSVYPELFNSNNIKDNSKSMFQKVTGTNNLFNAFFNNISSENILKIAQNGLDDFMKLRSKYLLYK